MDPAKCSGFKDPPSWLFQSSIKCAKLPFHNILVLSMSVIKFEEIGNENENHGQLLKKNNNIYLLYEQEEEEEPHGSRWEVEIVLRPMRRSCRKR